jgi:hypothetical protein
MILGYEATMGRQKLGILENRRIFLFFLFAHIHKGLLP